MGIMAQKSLKGGMEFRCGGEDDAPSRDFPKEGLGEFRIPAGGGKIPAVYNLRFYSPGHKRLAHLHADKAGSAND
ncbi:MAG: hypothetical protein QG555_896 [Thermodesulfobacteriota bacterium]|nr:hypothetical protein [Thermodesulfobacteriota bacterium]